MKKHNKAQKATPSCIHLWRNRADGEDNCSLEIIIIIVVVV